METGTAEVESRSLSARRGDGRGVRSGAGTSARAAVAWAAAPLPQTSGIEQPTMHRRARGLMLIGPIEVYASITDGGCGGTIGCLRPCQPLGRCGMVHRIGGEAAMTESEHGAPAGGAIGGASRRQTLRHLGGGAALAALAKIGSRGAATAAGATPAAEPGGSLEGLYVAIRTRTVRSSARSLVSSSTTPFGTTRRGSAPPSMSSPTSPAPTSRPSMLPTSCRSRA
jgi:hypothetical protein